MEKQAIVIELSNRKGNWINDGDVDGLPASRQMTNDRRTIEAE
jgi:hypothetical protein